MVKYRITLCNRCLEMEYSYFYDCVHRWCKAYNAPLEGMNDLTKPTEKCDKYNHPKGSKKKSKFIDKAKYTSRYPE